MATSATPVRTRRDPDGEQEPRRTKGHRASESHKRRPATGPLLPLPRAAGLQPLPRPGSRRAERQVRTTGDVTVAIYKYSDEANDFIPEASGCGRQLWQFQVDHPAYPKVTFNFKQRTR